VSWLVFRAAGPRYGNPGNMIVAAIVGAVAGAHVTMVALLGPRARALADHRPCFACGGSCRDVPVDERGWGLCPGCGSSIHRGQWAPPTQLPMSAVLRGAGKGAVTTFGLIALGVGLYWVVLVLSMRLTPAKELLGAWQRLTPNMQLAVDLTLVGLALALGARVYRSRQARLHDRQHLECRGCGHDLTGASVEQGLGVCAECGAPYAKIICSQLRDSMPEQFERHTRTFSLLTLVSRVTGLVRDAALSRVFGAAGVMDAFFFAFMIPNLFRRLFGEGAVSAAFLRAYARLEKSDPPTAKRLATLTVAIVIVALGSITVAGELLLLGGLRFAAPEQHLVVRLTMIMLPYMPMVCLVAILGSMLQVHGRFAPTAAVPIVMNLCVIAAVVGLVEFFGPQNKSGHITAVAMSLLVAGVLQLAWMAWSLRDRKWLVRDASGAREPMKEVTRQAGPMILGLGVLQLNVFFDGLIASYPTTVGPTIFGVEYPLAEGAMAAVSFAQRLYQFPLGVVGIAIATAIFPALTRQSDDPEAFSDILQRGLRLVVFIGLPASVGLMLIGPLLVRVIYEGLSFGAGDSRRVAFVLYGYAAGVWAYSMIHVLTRAFYARGDARSPVKVALWMVLLNVALNCTLIWTPLREAGLAWSTAICATLQVFVLLGLVRRHDRTVPGAGVLGCAARTIVITPLMALAVGVVLVVMPEPPSWRWSLVNLLAAVGAGSIVVFVAAAALGMPELRWAAGRSSPHGGQSLNSE
jgi:putative peptidoglycan lipid II flippase